MLWADIDMQGVSLIIAAIGTMLVSLVGAVFSGLAMLYSAKAKLAAVEAKEGTEIARLDVALVKEDVQKIEKATNSMKDALVKATGDASMLEGEKIGRAAEKSDQAQMALGVMAGKVRSPTPAAEPTKPIEITASMHVEDMAVEKMQVKPDEPAPKRRAKP